MVVELEISGWFDDLMRVVIVQQLLVKDGVFLEKGDWCKEEEM